MTTRSIGQSAMNMLPRTILALILHGLAATCSATVLREPSYGDASITIDCSLGGSYGDCAARKMKEVRNGTDQSVARVARMSGDEELDDGSVGEMDETARRKKGKGYGQMLLYFLGASKLTMLYVVMNAVTAIAGKALVVAKVALAIATALALKKATEQKENVSYEIIKHPHYSQENTHTSSVDFDPHGGYENDYRYRKRRTHH
ncbi:hypothetical protein WH47_04927 [Habropoda laboriosa]|uniref:Uncharacterized protein n=1 Tax=Habropoda laboriosa TaxID=597456 RepID=A0A0L7RJN6_9HYME|nr:PREDICTED: uncharacterized protein LOC108579898 [Habropoda laboriosa]KOC70941.1 hypothetical protein WH47_04927 [Habropoda laboriosa]